MAHDEGKANRWKITILDLLVFTASLCIAVRLLRAGIVGFSPHFDGFAPVKFTMGLFALAGSLGALVGKAYTGTLAGARHYCCVVLLVFIGLGFLTFMCLYFKSHLWLF